MAAANGMPESLADFEDAILGAGLDPAVESLIGQAGRAGIGDEGALQLLLSARRLAPAHPAPLIAHYRFHFYARRLAEAREVAVDAIALAARPLGLPADWRQVRPETQWPAERMAELRAHAVAPRFYLFALKGYAYLSLRLGEADEGRAVLDLLDRLDPTDSLGHRVLGSVLARAGRDVDYDEPEAASATPEPAP